MRNGKRTVEDTCHTDKSISDTRVVVDQTLKLDSLRNTPLQFHHFSCFFHQSEFSLLEVGKTEETENVNVGQTHTLVLCNIARITAGGRTCHVCNFENLQSGTRAEWQRQRIMQL